MMQQVCPFTSVPVHLLSSIYFITRLFAVDPSIYFRSATYERAQYKRGHGDTNKGCAAGRDHVVAVASRASRSSWPDDAAGLSIYFRTRPFTVVHLLHYLSIYFQPVYSLS